MAQFDVYPNPGKGRAAFPYLLDIQNPIMEDLQTRIVIPLGLLEHLDHRVMRTLTPVVEFEDRRWILLTPQLAAVPTKMLKHPVGTLAHFRDEIIAALDFAVTGI